MTVNISIVIPIHNNQDDISRAIESVVSQWSSTDELVLVNDGSTDNTQTIISEYQQQYSGQIQIIKQAQQGPGVARNQAIEVIQNNHVLFLDADDYLLPGALEQFKQAIAQNSRHVLWLASAQSKHYQIKLAQIGASCERNCRRYLKKRYSVHHGAFVVHRSVFSKARYAPLCGQEDLAFFLLLLAHFEPVVIDVCTVHVCPHPTSLRHTSNISKEHLLSLTNFIFGRDDLPDFLIALKPYFLARRYLSMSRTAYQQQLYAQALNFYLKAIQTRPGLLCKWGYLKRAISAIFNQLRYAT